MELVFFIFPKKDLNLSLLFSILKWKGWMSMQALSLLIKPASGNCNMRCQYCFYANVTNIREVKSKGIMSIETLEQLVKQTLSEVTDWVSFGFQGGEPMLAGRRFFEQLIAFQKKYNVHGTHIENSIQTNGTMINDKWAQFFHDNRFWLVCRWTAARKFMIVCGRIVPEPELLILV